LFPPSRLHGGKFAFRKKILITGADIAGRCSHFHHRRICSGLHGPRLRMEGDPSPIWWIIPALILIDRVYDPRPGAAGVTPYGINCAMIS